MDREIYHLAEALGKALAKKGWMLAVAESCTGGGICQTLTDVPGSSQWFDRGFITYSNQSKIDLLSVNQANLETFGAVSAEVAEEMAAGALANSNANIAISVTGIAGPGGGSIVKPVGTVFMAIAVKQNELRCFHEKFSGDRQSVRQQSCRFLLEQLKKYLTDLN